MYNLKKIYDEIYKKLPEYGSTNHGGYMQGYIVEEFSPKSILDIGCGKGQFCQYLDSNGAEAHGVDISAPFTESDTIKWYREDARKLPFEDNFVEWSSSFDVLEHIPENDLDSVLSEMSRISKKGFFLSICYRDSIYKVKGQTLHPTVKNSLWWKNLLSKYGKVIEHDIQPTYGLYVILIEG